MRIHVLCGVAALLLALAPTRASALVCGDGILDQFEECDDGNLVPGDCCSPLCTREPDADGDHLCDSHDPCTPTSAGGAFVVRGRITMSHLGAPFGDERVQLKGEVSLPTPVTMTPELTGLRFLVHDGFGTIVLDAALPPGPFDQQTRTGWQTSGRVAVWRGNGTLRKVIVKPRAEQPSSVRFAAVGREATVFTPQQVPVTLAIIPSATVSPPGTCAQISFDGVEGSGTGVCVLLNSSQRLVCR